MLQTCIICIHLVTYAEPQPVDCMLGSAQVPVELQFEGGTFHTSCLTYIAARPSWVINPIKLCTSLLHQDALMSGYVRAFPGIAPSGAVPSHGAAEHGSSHGHIIPLEQVEIAQVLRWLGTDCHLLIIVDNPASILPAQQAIIPKSLLSALKLKHAFCPASTLVFVDWYHMSAAQRVGCYKRWRLAHGTTVIYPRLMNVPL